MEQTLIDSIVQIGILPVIIGFLLFDFSKKLGAMQIELVKINEKLNTIDEIKEYLDQCKKYNNQSNR